MKAAELKREIGELGNAARMGAGDRVTLGMTGVVKNRLSVGPTAYSLGNG
jgi:hypothetical protein